MSQTAIPLEFGSYLQHQISNGAAVDMNEMIFVYIPDLDIGKPIDRTQGLPDESMWVHQQDIDQVGKLGDNALVYSVVILSTEPEFTFNAIYLHDKNVPNSCGMVVYKIDEVKELGSTVTKSLLQEYAGAAQLSGVTIDAETWQIDYQARLLGMEEDNRLACLDNYGHTAFIEGFDVIQQGDKSKYKIMPGVAYVGGLRAVLDDEVMQSINQMPSHIYIDVFRDGSALSIWKNILTITVSPDALSDYVDEQGREHYVARLVTIETEDVLTDVREMGGLTVHIKEDNPHPQYWHEHELASKEEAEEGLTNEKLMSAKRVQQWWEKLKTKAQSIAGVWDFTTELREKGQRVYSPNNLPPTLTSVVYFHDFGTLTSTITYELPEENIRFLHVGKAWAPSEHNDHNVIYAAFLDMFGSAIVSSTAVVLEMNKSSDVLVLPEGTAHIRFTISNSASPASIGLSSHYYMV